MCFTLAASDPLNAMRFPCIAPEGLFLHHLLLINREACPAIPGGFLPLFSFCSLKAEEVRARGHCSSVESMVTRLLR